MHIRTIQKGDIMKIHLLGVLLGSLVFVAGCETTKHTRTVHAHTYYTDGYYTTTNRITVRKHHYPYHYYYPRYHYYSYNPYTYQRYYYYAPNSWSSNCVLSGRNSWYCY